MSSAIQDYLNPSDPFILFGSDHLWALAISIALIIGLPWFAKKRLNQNHQHILGIVIGFIVMSNYVAWVILELAAGTFDLTRHLPLHLCRFANLAIPLVMWKRNYRMYEILYFWGLSGVLQGSITPDIAHGFPHFHFFRFFVGHNGLILAIVYATVVYQMRPTYRSIWKALIAMNIFLLVALVANLILGANYFWILGKPSVPSLLDYMGPWPWYILTGEFIALVHFGVAYLPIAVMNRKRVPFVKPVVRVSHKDG